MNGRFQLESFSFCVCQILKFLSAKNKHKKASQTTDIFVFKWRNLFAWWTFFRHPLLTTFLNLF
jgi:hypothetical protein